MDGCTTDTYTLYLILMSDSINTIQNRLSDVCSFDYDALKSTFDLLKVTSSPSALHGELCGYLCAGQRFEAQQWLDQVEECLHLSKKPEKSAIIQFIALKVNTLAQLESSEFELDFVLPSDDSEFSFRLRELAQWCMSFITAFALADGHSKAATLSEEGQEIFSDITNISQVVVDGDEQIESEGDLFSVQEHVKMGVLLIFTELNLKPSTPDNASSSNNDSQPTTMN